MSASRQSTAVILRNGFTLVELFFVIAILIILVCMLAPLNRGTHVAARRTMCMNNQKQIVLGCLNYESAHMKFPPLRGVLINGQFVAGGNAPLLSGFVNVLPHVEENLFYEELSRPQTTDTGVSYPAWGPNLMDSQFMPWQKNLPLLKCPESRSFQTAYGTTNYVFSVGDVAANLHNPTELRGVFGGSLTCKMSEIVDGTSNTVLVSEVALNYKPTCRADYATDQSATILNQPNLVYDLVDSKTELYLNSVSLGNPRRGGHWAMGEVRIIGFNTILPPNSPSAQVEGSEDGIFPVGSNHLSIVVVGYADGSTHSVPLDLDCGDSSAVPLKVVEGQTLKGKPSPFGVWGELGSINGREETQTNF